MDDLEIRIIGAKEGIVGPLLTRFAKFIQLRFPDCDDSEYIKEWATRLRFSWQCPERFMDRQSIQIYRELCQMEGI